MRREFPDGPRREGPVRSSKRKEKKRKRKERKENKGEKEKQKGKEEVEEEREKYSAQNMKMFMYCQDGPGSRLDWGPADINSVNRYGSRRERGR